MIHKYRALELDHPKGIHWVYGYYVEEKGFWKNNGVDDKSKPVIRYYIIDEYGVKFDICPDSVCQFTGIKDKNDTDIYNGDILRFFCKDFDKAVRKYKMDVNRWDFVVCYENGCYGYLPCKPELHHEDDLEFSCFWNEEDKEMRDMSNIEKIGTKFENPELLKG